MIKVSKSEMHRLRERFPNIHAVRTVHAYYVSESPKTVAFLNGGCGLPMRKMDHESRS